MMNDIEKDSMVRELRTLAREYGHTIAGSWLGEIDLDAIPVELVEMRGDTVGMTRLGCIFLKECSVPSVLFGTYIHELRHVWQWKRHPFIYIIGKILRPLIENDADGQETMSEQWMDGRIDEVVENKEGL